MWEWVLDAATFGNCCTSPYPSASCDDCAELSNGVGPGDRVQRGGCFTSAVQYIETRTRYAGNPGGPCLPLGGFRCARNP